MLKISDSNTPGVTVELDATGTVTGIDLQLIYSVKQKGKDSFVKRKDYKIVNGGKIEKDKPLEHSVFYTTQVLGQDFQNEPKTSIHKIEITAFKDKVKVNEGTKSSNFWRL